MSPKDAGQTPKRQKKRKAVRSKRDEFVHYLIRVTSWDYYYSLRGGDPKNSFDKTAFEELATLSFAGELTEPKLPKVDRGVMTFSGRGGMLNEPLQQKPRTIGSISSRAGELSAYVFTPQERLAELATVAQSQRVRLITLVGSKLRYGSALVHRVSMSTEVDEDDFL